MRAKLLKILRRDAKKKVRIEEKVDGALVYFWITDKKYWCLYSHTGYKMDYDFERAKIERLLLEYRRAYILEKLEELK